MTGCPSSESLVRLGRDSLDGSRFGEIEAHVQDCRECQGVLERLAADRTTRDGDAPGPPAGPARSWTSAAGTSPSSASA